MIEIEKKNPPKAMTEKQTAVARYFILHWKANGYWPTVR